MARRGGRVNKRGRSDGDQYAKLSYYMLNHAAWRSLSGSAAKVYFELHTRFHGRNNGALRLSLDEAARLLGMGKSTAKRAFNELASKGFIVMTRRGQWYGRKATEWRLTTKSMDGRPATNDWRDWRPEKPLNKQSPGTETAHIAGVTVPFENRGKRLCAV
jgi:hypothetical protein